MLFAGCRENPHVPEQAHGFLRADMVAMKNRLAATRRSLVVALEQVQQNRQQQVNVAAAANAVQNAAQVAYQQGVAAGVQQQQQVAPVPVLATVQVSICRFIGLTNRHMTKLSFFFFFF